jgi:hypothetical protein
MDQTTNSLTDFDADAATVECDLFGFALTSATFKPFLIANCNFYIRIFEQFSGLKLRLNPRQHARERRL